MISPRLRAGLVIGAVVVASAIAGAAADRAFVTRRSAAPREDRGRRSSSEQDGGRRRTQMLDRMTRELSLTPAQRVSLDSVFQRTDSSLRAVRREMQPRLHQVFERSRAEINARLDSAQRVKFATMRPPGRGGRGGGGGDHRGEHPTQTPGKPATQLPGEPRAQ